MLMLMLLLMLLLLRSAKRIGARRRVGGTKIRVVPRFGFWRHASRIGVAGREREIRGVLVFSTL